jgi:hypothetical protein
MPLTFLTHSGGCYDTAKRLRRNRAQRVHAGIRECKSAGPVPNDKLDFGIAILRTLPSGNYGEHVYEGIDWPLVGLMQWAATNDPSADNFDMVWSDLQTLYPRAPGYWQRSVGHIEDHYPDLWTVRPLFGQLLHPRPSIDEARAAGTIYVAKQHRIGPLPHHLFEHCI